MSLIVEGKRREAEAAHQDRAWSVWHAAALQRAKRMPPFDAFAGKKKRRPERRAQSADQMLTMARMWTAAANGEGGV